MTARWDEARERSLKPGDAVYLPPHTRHRVTWTDPGGPTVWLALFIDAKLGPGPDIVEAVQLDDLELRPTFIKLHLEGAELAALRGVEKTLRRCRPRIAATVYHNRDGLWRTLKHLADTLENYRFYFRLHAWCATGAVAYAVPDETLH